MFKLVLLPLLLLSSCLDIQKSNPEALKDHCAAVGRVTADRQMNIYYRRGGTVGGYNADEVARAAEKDCLEKQWKQQR